MPTQKQLDQAFENLVSKFPKRYRVKSTKYLQGLLKALAEGDAFIESQVEAVRDNLLVVTAKGKYLERLGSLYGVTKGTAVGVQDDDFRKLIPVLGMSPKQISHTIQQIVDVIYGPYASHANTTCSAPEPYNIKSGSKLSFLVDGDQIDIYFKETDAINLASATAQELATAISDRSNGRITGSVVSNVRTGENFVNARSNAIGTQGFIQVLGGDAQTALRFPEIRPTIYDIATWDITRFSGTDEMVFTVAGGQSPNLRSAGVRKGDFVTIRLDSGFAEGNTGTFPITFVEENSFRIKNGNGVVESGVTQIHIDDFIFYRPDVANILLAARPATVLQTAPKELTVLLPVTSPIVKRTLKGGHHFHGGLSVVTGVTANTMDVGATSGFPASGSVHVVSSRINSEDVVSSVGLGVVNMISAEGWPSFGSFYAPTTDTFYYYSGKSGDSLTGVSPQPPLDLSGATVKYSERYRYTGVTGNTLTGVYPHPAPTLGLEVSADIALEGEFKGSFLYDNASAFMAAKFGTTVKERIQQGSTKTVVQVGDVNEWPEQGYFILEFGSKEQEGPIRYFGKVGSTALLIDSGHVFERDHLKGTSIRLIRQIGNYTPRKNGDDYAVYLTSTSQARTLLAEYLSSVVAAGVVLKFQIQVPDYKWTVLPLLHAVEPLDSELAET
jgi:hypothetical protein